MTQRAYSAYRVVDTAFAVRVPAHWRKTSLKFLGEYLNGFPFKPEEWSEDGLPIIRIAQLTGDTEANRFNGELDPRFKVASGDLLFSWSATIDAYLWSRGDAWLNQHIFKVRPSAEATKQFLYYLIKQAAPKLADFDAHGSTMRHIKKESLGERVFVPSVIEQEAIADYLDRETARIDALIEKKTGFIELLREKRQALITNAVLRGSDATARLQDSRYEWLGSVPAHWHIRPLKYIARVQTGVAKGKDNSGRQTVTVPYLRVANVQDGYLDLDSVATIAIPTEVLPRYRLQAGDVLMNEGGDFDKLGRGHVWHGQIDPCIHQNHVFAVRPTGVSSEWLNTYTSSAPAQFYFMDRSKQSTNLASISSSNLMELPVPVPPAAEQVEILSRLSRRLARLESLMDTTQRSTEFLNERRAALITAAVTGQIDVRAEVPAEALA